MRPVLNLHIIHVAPRNEPPMFPDQTDFPDRRMRDRRRGGAYIHSLMQRPVHDYFPEATQTKGKEKKKGKSHTLFP